MSKVVIESKTTVYPMPAFLIGANVDGKPNYMAAAWSGIGGGVPPIITVGIRHARHTLKGIKQNMTFSVNVPSADLMKETDFCGIETGSKVDKVAACNFEVFYGTLKTAPMIEQFPVNLECTVLHMLDVGSHMLVVGRIDEAYASEDCLTDGKPDADKIRPFCYTVGQDRHYRTLGKEIGKAHSAGKEIKG